MGFLCRSLAEGSDGMDSKKREIAMRVVLLKIMAYLGTASSHDVRFIVPPNTSKTLHTLKDGIPHVIIRGSK